MDSGHGVVPGIILSTRAATSSYLLLIEHSVGQLDARLSVNFSNLMRIFATELDEDVRGVCLHSAITSLLSLFHSTTRATGGVVPECHVAHSVTQAFER
jgi:hypothetical protein